MNITVESTLAWNRSQVSPRKMTMYVYFNGFTDPYSPVRRFSPTTRARAWRWSVGLGFSAPGTFWVTPGPISLAAAAFPGFIFTKLAD